MGKKKNTRPRRQEPKRQSDEVNKANNVNINKTDFDSSDRSSNIEQLGKQQPALSKEETTPAAVVAVAAATTSSSSGISDSTRGLTLDENARRGPTVDCTYQASSCASPTNPVAVVKLADRRGSLAESASSGTVSSSASIPIPSSSANIPRSDDIGSINDSCRSARISSPARPLLHRHLSTTSSVQSSPSPSFSSRRSYFGPATPPPLVTTTSTPPAGTLRLRRPRAGSIRLQTPTGRSYYSTRSDDHWSNGTPSEQPCFTLSAAEVRQQTLSWTYRELGLAPSSLSAPASPLAKSVGPAGPPSRRPFGHQLSSPRKDSGSGSNDASTAAGQEPGHPVVVNLASSPTTMSPAGSARGSVKQGSSRKTPSTDAFDSSFLHAPQDIPRRRQVSQLSALRQLSLSQEKQTNFLPVGSSPSSEAGNTSDNESTLGAHEGGSPDSSDRPPYSERTPLLVPSYHQDRRHSNVPPVMSSYDAVVQAEAGTFHKFITHPEATANDTFGDGGDWGPPLAPNHGLPGGEGSRSSARGPIGVRVEESFRNFASSLKQVQVKDVWSWLTYTITLSPAVMLALILNLLDAMSYGIIIFPSGDENIPDTAQQAGISMFLASTVISQLVYTLGGSAFKGAVGSMMIEVMPFLHIICRTVEAEMQGADSSSILATVMVAYAMSTLLTGLVFLLLGIFKMGNLIQFFPRHILVGCIGGIGLFLVLTGVEVTTSIPNEYSIGWLKEIFAPSALKLWGSSLALAVLLKLMQRRIHHPLFVPLFYVGVPIIFYIIVFAAKIPMEELRRAGWLFAVPEGKAAPFYEFWTYYDFAKVQWSALPATIPTQLALTFFGILHVPINVPALAVSTQQDVDLNKELIGHGMSNLASGFMGSTQNYLVYSNSILYIRSGGNSVTGGLLLTLGTAAVWVAGGKVVTFVPTIIVGSLIFHLGIDLLKESMVDTWSTGIHNLEYLTILLIIFIMGVVGFTEGITAGLILACIFFVVMYARKSVIRAIYTGSQLRSTVHRLYRQQCFLDQVGDQIHIIKLQGFMFFGTINQLDQYVGQVLKDNPRIRYVVMDFSLIYGIDYSALESFHRIKRMLGETNTHLVFAGLTMVGSTLMRSGIFDIEEDDETHNVHNFETVNEALEWCENQLLVTYYAKQASREGSTLELSIPKAIVEPSLRKSDTLLGISFTPREKEIQQAASLILNDEPPLRRPESNEFLPVAILLQAFAETTDLDDEMLEFFGNRFERTEAAKDTVLWLSGEEARELYVVEEGELVLLIHEQDHTTQSRIKVVETLLPGTMVGELEMFSDRPRACRLIAQTDSVIWRLSKTSFDQMALENPGLMLKFVTKIALSFDAVRFYNTVYHWGQLK